MEGASAEAAEAPRTIKKYGNRRLYDTGASRYVTITDLRDLIRAQQSFVVQDAKSGEDLTRSVLLQILLDLESGDAPIFSEQALTHLIRLYSHPLQALMRLYLERNIGAMAQVHTTLAEGTGEHEAAFRRSAARMRWQPQAYPVLAPESLAGTELAFKDLQAEMYAHALQMAQQDFMR